MYIAFAVFGGIEVILYLHAFAALLLLLYLCIYIGTYSTLAIENILKECCGITDRTTDIVLEKIITTPYFFYFQ